MLPQTLIRKMQVMKVTKRVGLYFFGLCLVLLAGDLRLWAQDDHLAKFGVYRLGENIDAPEFTLPDLDGTPKSLSDFQGKFILLNFWATW